MRILLVNPWIYDFAAYDLWSKPIGLINIASQLRDLGFEVGLVDCLDRHHPLMKEFKQKESVFGDGHYYSQDVEKPDCFKDILRRYKRYGMPLSVFNKILEQHKEPDIILLGSGLTYWYPGVVLAAELLKRRFRHSAIILGGIYAKLCFLHAQKLNKVDYVFKQGNLFDLVKLIASFKRLRLSIKHKIKENRLNLSAYDLYPRLRYITLRTSKGCVLRCSYCGWYILNAKFSVYSDVDREIINSYYKFSIREFAFYDDALLFKAKYHFLKIFNSVLKAGIRCNFHTPNALHCTFITQEIADLMKATNFIHPRLGLESIDTKIQQRSDYKVSKRDFLNALRFLNNAGYKNKDIHVNLLVGLPNQKYQQVNDDLNFLEDFGLRIYLEEYSPVPYTDDFYKSGLRLEDDPLLHNNTAFVLRHPEFRFRIQKLKERLRRINNSLN